MNELNELGKVIICGTTIILFIILLLDFIYYAIKAKQSGKKPIFTKAIKDMFFDE